MSRATWWTVVGSMISGLAGVVAILFGGSVGQIVGILLVFWALTAVPVVFIRRRTTDVSEHTGTDHG
jgi:drug/metabolite transporter (DMT)-like permease